MKAPTRWRLAAMMALAYAVQGAWWPLLAVHLDDLGIPSRGRGWIFATMALASIATPLGAGQVADRLLATEQLLALIYGLGTGLLVLLALGVTTATGPLFLLFLTYWLLTAPGYGLCAALALRNLERPREQFGGVRLWGTFGWMAAGWVVSLVMVGRGSAQAGQGAFEAFVVAAVLSALLSAYSLTLPHTPPLAVGLRRLAWDGAIEVARRPAVGVFLALAFGVSLTTPFVYQGVVPYLPTLGLPRAWLASTMTLSQVLEITGLALLPALLRRLGYRKVLGLGIAAWVVYYALMATRPSLGVALLVVPLHGVAIALFHVAGPMFLDSQAPADRRASAQGLYLVMTSGLGCFLGNLLAGEIIGRIGAVDGRAFLVPCLINLAVLAAFTATFRPREEAEAQVERPGLRVALRWKEIGWVER
ncbi:MAG: MFS transporter [Isosphaeraceae bacterium]|nr:MFS transporter [Isosphaeraceae bacterium]